MTYYEYEPFTVWMKRTGKMPVEAFGHPTRPGMMVSVEPDEIIVIDKYGNEGVLIDRVYDRVFHCDPSGEAFTERLKPGEYAVIRIGDTDAV